jgi:hypothetical protein
VEGHVTVRFCDEFDGGFGRIVDDELIKPTWVLATSQESREATRNEAMTRVRTSWYELHTLEGLTLDRRPGRPELLSHDRRQQRQLSCRTGRCRAPVFQKGQQGWSLCGAPWLQLLATRRKSPAAETGANKPKPLP